MAEHELVFDLLRVDGTLARLELPAPLPGAEWYTAQEAGDGLIYTFPAGALADYQYLTADFLLDGQHLAVLAVALQEGDNGPVMMMSFGLLAQCQARMAIPLSAVDQNRWSFERQGAWLKPNCYGDRVDLSRVDRVRLYLLRSAPEGVRSAPEGVRWCHTPLRAVDEVVPLVHPYLPKGKLLDEFGQSAQWEWPGKTGDETELVKRLTRQHDEPQPWPHDYSRWGGWKGLHFTATGWFHTHHDGKRWWLVDPDGYAFWSSGLDCVRVDTDAWVGGLTDALTWLPAPDGAYREAFNSATHRPMFNYLAANFIRAFGQAHWHDHWADIAILMLKGMGFNTIANWSEWLVAAQRQTPYVRPLDSSYKELPCVFRDFPDIYAPEFASAADAFAEPLRATRNDPAFIGYFLMNEPTWGFASQTPAEGMLLNGVECHTRLALAKFLKQRYPDDGALSAAWGCPATLAQLAHGAWSHTLKPVAKADLAEFSAIMVEKFFGGLSAACRKVDPHHLNLGIRYYTIPPEWAVAGMKHFDVFSMNCYRAEVPASDVREISESLGMPVMVGEWHFGALDVGLPASGIGHVKTQADRGRAFRYYVENAAALPACVGVHYFTLYDESAIGRYDGENYNIGFLDVCNQPYEPLAKAARNSHILLYRVAAGEIKPTTDRPDYLSLLFM